MFLSVFYLVSVSVSVSSSRFTSFPLLSLLYRVCICYYVSLDLVHVVRPGGERGADLAELLPRKFLGYQGERIRQKLVVHRNNDNVQPLLVIFSATAAKNWKWKETAGTENKRNGT